MNSSTGKDSQSSSNPSLKNAWRIFAEYDENAKLQQKDFNWMQKWILALGVIATVLVLSQSQFRSFFQVDTLQGSINSCTCRTFYDVLRISANSKHTYTV